MKDENWDRQNCSVRGRSCKETIVLTTFFLTWLSYGKCFQKVEIYTMFCDGNSKKRLQKTPVVQGCYAADLPISLPRTRRQSSTHRGYAGSICRAFQYHSFNIKDRIFSMHFTAINNWFFFVSQSSHSNCLISEQFCSLPFQYFPRFLHFISFLPITFSPSFLFALSLSSSPIPPHGSLPSPSSYYPP